MITNARIRGLLTGLTLLNLSNYIILLVMYATGKNIISLILAVLCALTSVVCYWAKGQEIFNYDDTNKEA